VFSLGLFIQASRLFQRTEIDFGVELAGGALGGGFRAQMLLNRLSDFRRARTLWRLGLLLVCYSALARLSLACTPGLHDG